MTKVAAAATDGAVAAVTLQHATHIGMVTGGGSHTIGLTTPDDSPACAAGALLTPALQRAAAAQLVGDFIQQAFGGATTYRLQLVPGTTSTLDLASHTTAELVPGTASPAQVDPATVTYTRSTTPILPPPPRDFMLHQKGEGDV